MIEWYDVVNKQLDELRDTQSNYENEKSALLDDYKNIILLLTKLEELEKKTVLRIVKEEEPWPLRRRERSPC